MKQGERRQKGGAAFHRGVIEDNNCEHRRRRHQQFARTKPEVQRSMEDISLIYALVCATYFLFLASGEGLKSRKEF